MLLLLSIPRRLLCVVAVARAVASVAKRHEPSAILQKNGTFSVIVVIWLVTKFYMMKCKMHIIGIVRL